MPHYTFIDQPDTLVQAVSEHERIGVDTEFMREKTYFAQLCLVQIATPDEIYCVDPLSDGEHRDFWQALLARNWVVHSARQDIEVIWQLAGTMPAAIFDTQIAAGLLGYPAQMGYAGLVKELFDADMDKSHTRADWTRRPLKEAWLQYAAEDVEHLLPAHELLRDRLEREGRLEWALQDAALLLDPGLYEVGDGQAIERLKGARNLRGRRRAAAARLATWREAEAIRRDRPRQWIVRDNVLLEIANKLPATEQELAALEGIPPKLVNRVGRQLLQAVAASASDDNGYSPTATTDRATESVTEDDAGASSKVRGEPRPRRRDHRVKA